MNKEDLLEQLADLAKFEADQEYSAAKQEFEKKLAEAQAASRAAEGEAERCRAAAELAESRYESLLSALSEMLKEHS